MTTLSWQISKTPIDNALPLDILKTKISEKSERQDLHYFYMREHVFADLCGSYGVSDTAKFLYDHNLLKCRSDRFTYPAKIKLFGDSRTEVFAIKKSILD